MNRTIVLAALCLAGGLVPGPIAQADVQGNTEIAELMNAYAAFKMGDYAKARNIWLPIAERGNTSAMNQLAAMYEQGQGVEQDLEAAVEWRRRAAQGGDPIGQLYLGLAYETGRGVAQDNHVAAEWFRKAADQGDVDAQFNLGIMLATAYGRGTAAATEQQRAEAMKWLSLAAANGNPDAKQFIQMLQ